MFKYMIRNIQLCSPPSASQTQEACRERGPRDVSQVKRGDRTVNVTFADTTTSDYPYVWLRENCQCPNCFQSDAIARLFLVDDLDINIQPKEVQVRSGGNGEGKWEMERGKVEGNREGMG